MKKNIFIFFAFCFLLFSAMKCTKDSNNFMPGYPPYDDSTKLPPITQNGANTFGFILNGKVWRPHGIETTPTPMPATLMGG